jgi:non-specific serine/threonine protein kinase
LKNELLIEDNLNSDDSYRKTIYAYCISFTDDIHYPFLIRPITAKGKPEENKIVSHIKPVDFYHNEKIGVASSYFSPSSFWNIDKRADDNEVNPEKLKTGLRLLKKIFPQLKNELVFQVPEIDRIRKMDLEEVFFFPEHNPLLSFTFTENDNYYILKTFLSIEGKKIPIKEFKTFGVVVMLKDSDLYLLSSPQDAMVVQYFRKNHELLFPKTSFEDVFKTAVYPLINDYNVSINVKKNIEEYKHKKVLTSIYLSELNDFVLFTPMMEYDDIQVKLFNETNVVMNASGQVVKLNRDLDLESDFQEFFLKLNPKFEARMNRDLFYLTVNELMQNQWFFEFFNKAKDKGVEVFGFDKLKNFKYSPHKAKVVVNVSSGIDWFDTTIEISF